MPNRPRIRVWAIALSVASFCSVAALNCRAEQPDDVSSRHDPDQLVIHEWGTFTSLQDEHGNAIAGINENDEPVPGFVHRIANFLLLAPEANAPILYQGAPQCHPDVTMRLETPVVYFHPSANTKLPITLDLEVAFHSGWLSEYYPNAEVEAPGVTRQMQFGPIRNTTVGRLRWKNLEVGTSVSLPATSSAVWLAPRAVQAVAVKTETGEQEQFLFYRGVGHVDSPLRISQDVSGQSLEITGDFRLLHSESAEPLAVRQLWLVDVREDKSCAFREISGTERITNSGPRPIAKTAVGFADSEYESGNVSRLCASMRTALIRDGLFPDEADALLNTWKFSYFQSTGLRLFYLLPRPWTDHVLPMRVSVGAEIVRTMVGRVELVTARQRQLLQQISAGPASRPSAAKNIHQPPDFHAYDQLGRFRNALVLEELERRPTTELQSFINHYGLQSYKPLQIDQHVEGTPPSEKPED